jgi:hypothetical protein
MTRFVHLSPLPSPPLQLTITIEAGPIRLVIAEHNGKKVLCFSAPFSNGFTFYRFDQGQKQWVGVKDGHHLIGVLVREMVWGCKGIPTF